MHHLIHASSGVLETAEVQNGYLKYTYASFYCQYPPRNPFVLLKKFLIETVFQTQNVPNCLVLP